MGESEAGVLERFGTSLDKTRAWLRNIGKIAFLMAKGAHLVTDRRKLLERLGQKAYERMQAGQLVDPELEALSQQVHRVSKKLEIEEMLVNGVRYGYSKSRHRQEKTDATKPREDSNVSVD